MPQQAERWRLNGYRPENHTEHSRGRGTSDLKAHVDFLEPLVDRYSRLLL
ncbi:MULTISPECIES: hypothetical protein [unclassified Streptomyces]|nr:MULTISPECIES: hypothetical protein [unclassified Streptomyces]